VQGNSNVESTSTAACNNAVNDTVLKVGPPDFSSSVRGYNSSHSLSSTVCSQTEGSVGRSQSFSSIDVNNSTCGDSSSLALSKGDAEAVKINNSQNNSRFTSPRKSIEEYWTMMKARKIILCRNGELSYKVIQ